MASQTPIDNMVETVGKILKKWVKRQFDTVNITEFNSVWIFMSDLTEGSSDLWVQRVINLGLPRDGAYSITLGTIVYLRFKWNVRLKKVDVWLEGNLKLNDKVSGILDEITRNMPTANRVADTSI